MKSITLIMLLAISQLVNGQIEQLSFNECYVGARVSQDSSFNHTGYFQGLGTVEIFNDSIIITFSNKWESGKYLLYIEGREDFRDEKDYVTHFYGGAEYFGWTYDLLFIKDQFKNPSAVILDTGDKSEGEEYFTKTRRLYPIIPQKRILINNSITRCK